MTMPLPDNQNHNYVSARIATADHLDAAADYIRRFGHTKGALSDGDEVCALGAINRTHQGNSFALVPAATTALWAWVRENTAFGWVVTWNDDPQTTADDVINGLGKAANELREKVQ